jgi:hypothetical protein
VPLFNQPLENQPLENQPLEKVEPNLRERVSYEFLMGFLWVSYEFLMSFL